MLRDIRDLNCRTFLMARVLESCRKSASYNIQLYHQSPEPGYPFLQTSSDLGYCSPYKNRTRITDSGCPAGYRTYLHSTPSTYFWLILQKERNTSRIDRSWARCFRNPRRLLLIQCSVKNWASGGIDRSERRRSRRLEGEWRESSTLAERATSSIDSLDLVHKTKERNQLIESFSRHLQLCGISHEENRRRKSSLQPCSRSRPMFVLPILRRKRGPEADKSEVDRILTNGLIEPAQSSKACTV